MNTNPMSCCEPTNNTSHILKLDVMSQWIEMEWLPQHSNQDLLTLWVSSDCIDTIALEKFDRTTDLSGGFRFSGYQPIDCPIVTCVSSYSYEGKLAHRTGASVYRFSHNVTGEVVEILVVGAHYSNECDLVCLAVVPRVFLPAWAEFSKECIALQTRLSLFTR
jgi:hypothetical protein